MESAEDDIVAIKKSRRIIGRMLIFLSVRSLVIVGSLILTGCSGLKESSEIAPSSSGGQAQPAQAPSAVLKHKMECRELGRQAEKEKFPEWKNTVESINEGLIYFESEFGYSQAKNTCVMLTGYKLTDFKTKTITAYQATLTDLLTNKMLDTYLVLGGQLAPASTSRDKFIARVRDLLGEPVPKWLEEGPIP